MTAVDWKASSPFWRIQSLGARQISRWTWWTDGRTVGHAALVEEKSREEGCQTRGWRRLGILPACLPACASFLNSNAVLCCRGKGPQMTSKWWNFQGGLLLSSSRSVESHVHHKSPFLPSFSLSPTTETTNSPPTFFYLLSPYSPYSSSSLAKYIHTKKSAPFSRLAYI